MSRYAYISMSDKAYQIYINIPRGKRSETVSDLIEKFGGESEELREHKTIGRLVI